jgi:hypothetical protein
VQQHRTERAEQHVDVLNESRLRLADGGNGGTSIEADISAFARQPWPR